MPDKSAFAIIRNASRIWAIGSIHGEATKLQRLHDRIGPRLKPNDRLIYLGNYLGYGPDIVGTVDEILDFRRRFLAQPPYTDSEDFILLRGSQEEMWQRVLQLQFAVNPVSIMDWMAERGLAATLAAYAGESSIDILGSRTGPLTVAQWTGSVRDALHAAPGHVAFMSALKRAAFTADKNLLFVNAGFDINRPVEEQSDVFWWAGKSFRNIDKSYEEFLKIVRGFDPDNNGFLETEYTLTLDGGCGFEGSLISVCLSTRGEVLDRIEV